MEKKYTIYPKHVKTSRNVSEMKLLSIFFLSLSLGASIWAVFDVDPMRETCTRFRDEVVLSAALNALTFTFGACCTWLCGRFLLVTLSALATVSLSRVTLFAYDLKIICAADIASAPVGDILTDVTVFDRVQFTTWFALVFFALGLLTAHISSDILDWFDISRYMPHRRAPQRRHYKKDYRPTCEEDEEDYQSPKSPTTWIRIPY